MEDVTNDPHKDEISSNPLQSDKKKGKKKVKKEENPSDGIRTEQGLSNDSKSSKQDKRNRSSTLPEQKNLLGKFFGKKKGSKDNDAGRQKHTSVESGVETYDSEEYKANESESSSHMISEPQTQSTIDKKPANAQENGGKSETEDTTSQKDTVTTVTSQNHTEQQTTSQTNTHSEVTEEDLSPRSMDGENGLFDQKSNNETDKDEKEVKVLINEETQQKKKVMIMDPDDGKVLKRTGTKKKKLIELDIPRLPGKERFASYFFVVGVGKTLEPLDPRSREQDPMKRYYKPELLECFPNSTKDDPLPPHTELFCFPRSIQLRSFDPGQTCFPYVLTNIAGDRIYASALTFYEPMQAEMAKAYNLSGPVYVPKCICVLSHWPFHSLFREWLFEIYRKSISKLLIPLESYIINFIMEVPLPPPRNIKIKLSIGEKWVTVSRPPANTFPLSDVPFSVLFKSLGISNVLTIFKCLLVEEKVLFHSRQYTLLAFACETIQLLMHPFQWPHVFVPILPEFLLDFVYSPTPFVMGVNTDYLLPIIDLIKQDVTIVDLDNNSVQIPVQLPEFPKSEIGVLMNDLKRILHADMLYLDSPSMNPFASTPKTKNISYQEVNEQIQCAFLKFFCSLFKDYRSYLLYVRVFPNPVAIFDSANFLELRSKNKDFYEAIVISQAFSSFLEEYNWPKQNIFDEWIDNEVYLFQTDDIIQKFSPSSFLKDRFPEIVTVPPPQAPEDYEPIETTSWPPLNYKLFQEARGVYPVKIKQDMPVITRNYSEKPSFSPTSPVEPFKESRPLMRTIVNKVINNASLEEQDMLQLAEFFKSHQGRKEFALALLEHKNGEREQLSDQCFSQLSQMLEILLKEAHASNDFVTPKLLISVVFLYYRLENGADEYIYTRVRKHDIWQQQSFWEKAFFDSISKQYQEMFGNIRLKMEKWSNMLSKEKDSLTTKEVDAVFTMLSTYAFNMVSLGVDVEMIRRFMLKMCNVTMLDEEKTKIIMQLVSNMTRANELIDEAINDINQTSELYQLRFKKGDKLGYLPVGISRHVEKENDALQVFKEFIEGKDAKLASLKKPRRKTFKPSWLGQTKKQEKENAAEMREDYTVKTYTGHTEGVLSVAADATVIASGSCDGTVRLWSHLNTECMAVFSGHTGWVNLVYLDGEGRLVSGSYDRHLKLWDITKQAKIHTFRGHKGSITCAKQRDKHTLISGAQDNNLFMWDGRHYKKPISSFHGHTGAITCIAIEENYLLSGSRDATLKLWDIRLGKVMKTFSGHKDWIKCCKLDKDTVISGSCDSTMRIWNSKGDDYRVLEGHSGTINDFFTDSQLIVTGSADSTVKVWDSTYGKCYQTLEGHIDEVVVCVPFQTNIASGSYDTTIKVWDAQKASLIATLSGHKYRISSMVAWENKLISGSWDKTIKLWEFPVDFRA